jgi:hypothetical protein
MDLNEDGIPDLVIVGNQIAFIYWKNDSGKFKQVIL